MQWNGSDRLEGIGLESSARDCSGRKGGKRKGLAWIAAQRPEGIGWNGLDRKRWQRRGAHCTGGIGKEGRGVERRGWAGVEGIGTAWSATDRQEYTGLECTGLHRTGAPWTGRRREDGCGLQGIGMERQECIATERMGQDRIAREWQQRKPTGLKRHSPASLNG